MSLTTIDTVLTPTNIMFVLGLLGILFTIYNHFKKPQEENDINKVVTEKDLGTKATVLAQKEAEGKAQLLAQQVLTEKEYNSKKFIELTERFDKTDDKIEDLTVSINKMNLSLSNQLTKVETIVQEHMKITA